LAKFTPERILAQICRVEGSGESTVSARCGARALHDSLKA
jgi:hypothetical protein